MKREKLTKSEKAALETSVRFILAQNLECIAKMMPYLEESGVEGAKMYDHALAVMLLRDYDSQDMLKGYDIQKIWNYGLVPVLKHRSEFRFRWGWTHLKLGFTGGHDGHVDGGSHE